MGNYTNIMAWIRYLLLVTLWLSYSTEELFHSECIISSNGKWIVYDINKNHNTTVQNYGFVNATIQLCDFTIATEFCKDFKFNQSYDCDIKNDQIWCPVEHIFITKMMRLVVRDYQSHSYYSAPESLPLSDCRCLWMHLRPTNFLHSNRQKTIIFSYNDYRISPRQYSLFYRPVNALSAWMKADCNKINDKYKCSVKFKRCMQYNVCINTTMYGCHGNGMICKIFNSSIKPYDSIVPNGVHCVVIDDNKIRISWKNVHIKNVYYKYIVYKSKNNQLFSGRTTKTVVLKTAATSSLLHASVNACVDCYCSRPSNVHCDYEQTAKSRFSTLEITLSACMPFLLILFVMLICRFRKPTIKIENIHPASDKFPDAVELSAVASMELDIITPNNVYEEIEHQEEDDNFMQLNLDNTVQIST